MLQETPASRHLPAGKQKPENYTTHEYSSCSSRGYLPCGCLPDHPLCTAVDKRDINESSKAHIVARPFCYGPAALVQALHPPTTRALLLYNDRAPVKNGESQAAPREAEQYPHAEPSCSQRGGLLCMHRAAQQPTHTSSRSITLMATALCASLSHLQVPGQGPLQITGLLNLLRLQHSTGSHAVAEWCGVHIILQSLKRPSARPGRASSTCEGLAPPGLALGLSRTR